MHLPKMNFLGQDYEKLEHYRQTDRQTDRQSDQQEYYAAFEGGDEYVFIFIL